MNKSINHQRRWCNPYQLPRADNYLDAQVQPRAAGRRLVQHIRNHKGVYLLLGLAQSDVLLAAAYESPRLHPAWQRAAELLSAFFFAALVAFWFCRMKAFRRFERAGLAVLFAIFTLVAHRFRPDGTPVTGGMAPFLFIGSFELLFAAMAATAFFCFLAHHYK